MTATTPAMPNTAAPLDVSELTVYGADWCGDCRRTKRWLDESGTPYTYVDRDADPELRAALAGLGFKAIPVVVFPGGPILVEPSNADLAGAVLAAGFED